MTTSRRSNSTKKTTKAHQTIAAAKTIENSEIITQAPPYFSSEYAEISEARHSDPFHWLGKHPVDNKKDLIRIFAPFAENVTLLTAEPRALSRVENTDFFELTIEKCSKPYLLGYHCKNGEYFERYDPYCFPPQLTDFDLHLFAEGKHHHAYQFLGAHLKTVENISGVLFAVWAPNAQRVSVVGDFNQWDGRCNPMRVRGASGVWELFIPNLNAELLYKFEIRHRETGTLLLKSDPYGQGFEKRPHTASYVVPTSCHEWQDSEWMGQRLNHDWQHKPMSIYEVHLGSWQKRADGTHYTYRELAEILVPYVKALNFTHIELLPISEYPLDESWGYQVSGYFAPTSRYGSAEDFRYFVDCCHQQHIGVLLDWVPAHFPKDAHGLARFDGSAVYEYEDPRLGEHKDWGTLIFNYARNEVKCFLISNAVYWLEQFHIDGLRVDAVASMLYLNYSRNEGEWLPNRYGGTENLEAIDFLRELNSVVHAEQQGVLMIAEESTSFPLVTRPTWLGGLGFNMKWNMGWMHDTLNYMSKDSIYRSYYHQHLTFGLLYAFSENFMLPFSHDEVVHGKKSLLDKMSGDSWQRFANLRLLYTFMWTYCGKKLLFMGNEFAQGREWSEARALDWDLLNYQQHQTMSLLIKDLNQLYQAQTALHHYDFDSRGFSWVDCHDAAQSVLCFYRRSDDDELLILLNFTPVPRYNYRVGVAQVGVYQELLNSDKMQYGGSNIGNPDLVSEEVSWMNLPHSIVVTLPPLAGVILQRVM